MSEFLYYIHYARTFMLEPFANYLKNALIPDTPFLKNDLFRKMKIRLYDDIFQDIVCLIMLLNISILYRHYRCRQKTKDFHVLCLIPNVCRQTPAQRLTRHSFLL